MTSAAVFSSCGLFRERLDRHLGDGQVAVVCMANPSQAGAQMNDPTIASLNRLLPLRDIGRYIVCNHETFIATDPADMRAWRDEFAARDYAAYRAHRQHCLQVIRTPAPPAPIHRGDRERARRVRQMAARAARIDGGGNG